MDGTHGTNGYDFMLITVIVIDEYGEGFPVAWCISNREDQLLLINFFKALRKRVGDLSPAWFMSDLAEQYYMLGSHRFITALVSLCAHGIWTEHGGKSQTIARPQLTGTSISQPQSTTGGA